MLYAMFSMILLTVVVGIFTVKARFASVKARTVDPAYFKHMQGDNIPEWLIRTTRCFNNQFEVPMLFYVAASLHLSLGVDSTLAIALAWAFVLSRCVHAAIYLSYNHVLHRAKAYWVGLLLMLGLWLNLLVHAG